MQPFGTSFDGKPARLYTLANSNGFSVSISDFGATIVSLLTPDREGQLGDVVLGFQSAGDYDAQPKLYLGGIVGRFAGRIANARFVLNNRQFQLPANDGPNTLHGGTRGFNRRLWNVAASDRSSIRLTYRSPDGEEGFPGTLDVFIEYALTEANELRILYTAETDQPTVLNLTNHAYFNLAAPGTSISSHILEIPASTFLPNRADSIPTGARKPVDNTAFDFRTPHTIGSRISSPDSQIAMAGGYDHTWVLTEPSGNLRLAARVTEPASGRVMEVLTTQPGILLYSGNYLDGSVIGKEGISYPFRSGFCLETQHFPNSPNQPRFPSTVLEPGQTYRQETFLRFGVVGQEGSGNP